MSNSFINWNDFQFKTVSYNIKKNPTQSPKPNTISGILYSGHCTRHQAMAKILGVFLTSEK